MAFSDRFVGVGEEELERLLSDKDSENRKRKISSSLKYFRTILAKNYQNGNFESFTCDVLEFVSDTTMHAFNHLEYVIKLHVLNHLASVAKWQVFNYLVSDAKIFDILYHLSPVLECDPTLCLHSKS